MSFVGIDIGGSKTHGLRVADEGAIVAEAFAGSANIASVGSVEAARQLSLIAQQLSWTPQRASSAIRSVCVGAAGVDSPQAELRLRPLVEAAFPSVPVIIVHDTELVLAAAGLIEGIVLVSGTGSAAWGRTTRGEQARASGWGYLLGDEGSGYGVIRAALRHTLDQLDTGDRPDELATTLLEACSVTGAAELLELFYRTPSRREWAARAGLVFDVADRGDPAATAIVEGAAAELVRAARRVGRRLGLTGPVMLAGGLLVHQPKLQALVEGALSSSNFSDLRVLDTDPVCGAVTLARRAS